MRVYLSRPNVITILKVEEGRRKNKENVKSTRSNVLALKMEENSHETKKVAAWKSPENRGFFLELLGRNASC